MKIITISGLDGSGKSTQIEMLKSYLESQGKKVFYFHAVQFSVGRFGKGTVSTSKSISVHKANWFQIQLRKLALRIDLCRFSRLIKKLEKQGYDYLVSDRYFYDSIVNIEYLSNPEALGASGWSHRVPPTPQLPIYLDTFPQTIMQRERIPDQGLEYLQKKKELYDAKTSVWNWKVVDGNRDAEVIQNQIVKWLNG